MAQRSASAALQEQVEILFTAGTAVGLSDRDLLERFLDHGREPGELAFRTLVERHAAMVLRVCNQGLRDRHAAEDAFQVTFLVLARHARSIRQRDSLESWLFGVASRAAAQIRMLEARRARYERRGASIRAESQISEPDSRENWPELHSEIARLPEKYQAPIVLCYFDGLTHEQAADRLGWPVGTVKARLARARDQLRWRLGGRVWNFGLAPPGELVRYRSGIDVPRELLDATLRAAFGFVSGGSAGGAISSSVHTITEGVLKAMLFYKLRLAAVMLFGVAALGLSAIALARQTAGKPKTSPPPAAASQQHAVLRVPGKTAIAPESLTNIASWVDCRIDKVLVDLGSRVRKGDPLLELTSSDVAEAKSRLIESLNQWHPAKEELDRLTQAIDRSKPLPEKLRQARAAERILHSSVTTWMGALEAYGLTGKEIAKISKENEIQKAKLILRSKTDGIVFKRNCVPGNYYDSQDTLLVIAQDDPLIVTGVVDPLDAGELEVGQLVTVTLPFDDRAFNVKIEALSKAPDSGKLTLRTSIPNSDHRVKPDLFVRLGVDLGPQGQTPVATAAQAHPKSQGSLEERLAEAERKLGTLLEGKDGRSPNAEILNRLKELERKLDRALNLGPGK